MNSSALQMQPISVEEYLSGEELAHERHEYIDGFVYAMVGATNAHSIISRNILVALTNQLRKQACQPFGSDTKIRVRSRSKTFFYYPDVMVICEENSRQENFQDKPRVIAEVLSTSTRRIDENEKRDIYLQIPTLDVYLLVDQYSISAKLYRRRDANFVPESFVGLEAIIPLPEIQCKLMLADAYEGLKMEEVTK